MRKNKPVFIIVIILLIIATLLIIKQTTSTLRSEQSDFAIEDTASVTKIFMSDKKDNTILLNRLNNGKWNLNNKYEANTEGVNMLLKTFYNLAVRAPVSKAAHNNIISRMAVLAVKVEVYQLVYRINLFERIKLFRHEKLTKTFYVGDDTSDRIGTYMLMEGSSQPYIIVIPSFRGFLSTRFIPDESLWRDQTIFSIKLKDIKSVRMEFPSAPDSSFSINSVGKFTFSLTRLSDNKSLPYDTLKLLQFLSAFQDIKYEALINKTEIHKKDSILGSMPWHVLAVTDFNGKTTFIKTFHKNPEYGEYFDEAINQKVVFDRDRLYALINDGRDFAIIQFFVFEKLLKSVNNFKPNY